MCENRIIAILLSFDYLFDPQICCKVSSVLARGSCKEQCYSCGFNDILSTTSKENYVLHSKVLQLFKSASSDSPTQVKGSLEE